MSKKFLTNIDLGASARVIALAPDANSSDPASPKLGQIFFNTNTNSLKFYNGSTWQAIAAGGSTFTLGTTTVSIGGTTTSVSGLTLISPSISQILNTGSLTLPTTTGTLALLADVTTASNAAYTAASNFAITQSNSASLNAYNAASAFAVTQSNSASLTAYNAAKTYADSASSNAYTQSQTYANSASSNAYTQAQTYANSASSNAYTQAQTYANSASLNAANTASGWSTLQKVTTTGSTTSNAISITNATQATNATTGALTVTGGVGINGNVFIGGNLEVTGSGYFGGSAVNITASNLNISDSLIYLANNNPADIVDIGFVGNYNDGTYQHTGLARDASDGKYKLFYNVIPEPTTTIDFSSASYSTLVIGALEVKSSGLVANLNAQYLGGQASTYYAPLNSPTFTGTVNLGSNVATGSVVWANTTGNATTTSQTNFSSLTVNNINVARVSASTIGDGSNTSYPFTHNFGTRDVVVNVYDVATYDTVEVDVVRTTASVVTLTFVSPPSSNSYRVVVTG